MSAGTPQFVEASDSAREVRDLYKTIAALRETVEKMRVERDQIAQQTLANSHQEIAQLRATAAALRESLESERGDKQRQIQEAVRAANDEIKQLKAVIAAIRETSSLAMGSFRKIVPRSQLSSAVVTSTSSASTSSSVALPAILREIESSSSAKRSRLLWSEIVLARFFWAWRASAAAVRRSVWSLILSSASSRGIRGSPRSRPSTA